MTAIIVLATAFRDVIERIQLGDVTVGNSAIAHEEVDPEVKKDLQESFRLFVPNEQTVGRVLSRKLWSVTREEFDRNNLKPVPTDGRAKALNTEGATEEDDRLNVDYLLQDEDDENGDIYAGGINTDDERRNEDDEIGDCPYKPRSPSPSRSPSAIEQPYRPPESGAGHMFEVAPPTFDEDENQDEDDEDDQEDIDDRINDSEEEEED